MKIRRSHFQKKKLRRRNELIISEKIYLLMEQRGISQKEFANRTGISQSTISDWKRKKTNPAADKIMKICEVLHVSPYELLSEGKPVDYDLVLSRGEITLIQEYRALSERQKDRLRGYFDALKEEC